MMEKEYRLIIAGGRDFNDYDYLKESCMSIIDKLKNDNDIMHQAIRQMLCYLCCAIHDRSFLLVHLRTGRSFKE